MRIEAIQTERLRLRQLRLTDQPFLAEILAAPHVMEFSDDGPLDIENQKKWLQNTIASVFDNHRLGTRAIEQKSDGKLIGYIGLSNKAGRTKPGELELGFRLAEKFWGQGYASESAIKFIEAATRNNTITRIISIVDPNNHRSVRLLRKLGMAFERDIEFLGYDHPDHLYALHLQA